MLPLLENYIFALLVLFIIFLSSKKKTSPNYFNVRLFMYMIATTSILLVADYMHVLFDNNPGVIYCITMKFLSLIIFLIAPILSLCWFYYVDNFIKKNIASFQRYRKWIFIPFIINAILTVTSLFANVYFTIDNTNAYIRGPYFLIHSFILYFYLIAATINLISNRKEIPRTHFIPMILFAVLPAIAGVLQIVFFGLLIIWPTVTLALLMCYIFVQTQLIGIDHLTSLYNRYEYDYYLNSVAKLNLKEQRLIGFSIDLDGLKFINDNHGHPMGDEVLKALSSALKASCSPRDFIARIGGDEFIILIIHKNANILEVTLDNIKQNIDAINLNNSFPFLVKISIGADLYDETKHESIPNFLEYLDALMYDNKREANKKGI